MLGANRTEPFERVPYNGDGFISSLVVGATEHAPEYLQELRRSVVLRMNVLVESRLEPWVAFEECQHGTRVSGNDHNQAVAVVLHQLKESIDRLRSIIL